MDRDQSAFDQSAFDQSVRTAPPDISSGTRQLAERLGAGCFNLRVCQANDVNRSVRSLQLEGDGLRSMDHRPGQDLMLRVTADSNVRRRYTIRALDRHEGVVTLAVVRHGDGPGARWAASAAPGQWVEAIGPRGKVGVAAGNWHLFIGDESFCPAALAMAESLEDDQDAILLLEVDGPEDDLPVEPALAGGVRWVHRIGSHTDEGLVAAVRDLRLPTGPGHAYVGGEMRAVAAVRAQLLDRGLSPDDISAKAYWRADTPNADRGEPDQ